MRLAPSPAAQFQAIKTRARLAAQLIWQALISLVTIWILLITLVVWHEVGRHLPHLDHLYFGRWIVCSLFAARRALDTWLAGPAMYRHTFYQAFRHTAGSGWGLLADLVPLGLAFLLMGWRRPAARVLPAPRAAVLRSFRSTPPSASASR